MQECGRKARPDIYSTMHHGHRAVPVKHDTRPIPSVCLRNTLTLRGVIFCRVLTVVSALYRQAVVLSDVAVISVYARQLQVANMLGLQQELSESSWLQALG